MYYWHLRFIAIARHVAEWSKDPDRRVGCVIVDADRRVISLGYNGLPKGVDDDAERYSDRRIKLEMTQHAELNAILFADRERLKGATIYVTTLPCSRCAAAIIQAGLGKVVAPFPDNAPSSWTESWRLAKIMFDDSQVEIKLVEDESPC